MIETYCKFPRQFCCVPIQFKLNVLNSRIGSRTSGRTMKKSISQEESLLLALGQVILKRRTRARMSQQELADLSEVHRPYISDIERGQRNLTITTMIRISNALKAPLSTLFREAEAGMGKAGR